MSMRAEERILENLLGSLTIAGQATSRPEDERTISLEERFEGVEIISLESENELTVGCGRGLRALQRG